MVDFHHIIAMSQPLVPLLAHMFETGRVKRDVIDPLRQSHGAGQPRILQVRKCISMQLPERDEAIRLDLVEEMLGKAALWRRRNLNLAQIEAHDLTIEMVGRFHVARDHSKVMISQGNAPPNA